MWCQYCSTVAHLKCLDPRERHMTSKRAWICPDCLDEIQDSRQLYLAEKERRHQLEVNKYYQTRLAARWRAFVQKREFDKLVKAATILQAVIRCGAAFLPPREPRARAIHDPLFTPFSPLSHPCPRSSASPLLPAPPLPPANHHAPTAGRRAKSSSTRSGGA